MDELERERRRQEELERRRRRISDKLAGEPDLNGVDLKVFLYLSARVDFVNQTRVPQVDIASALGKNKAHVSRSIRKLKDKEIIFESSEKVERSSLWRLNPDYGK